MEAARGKQKGTCCLHIKPCRLTLPAADKQDDVDVEPDMGENMSTATQSDKAGRPFSRHWDGAQPDTAAHVGDDWWNYLQEVSAEQVSHDAFSLAMRIAHAVYFVARKMCVSREQHIRQCFVFLQPEELDNTFDSDVVDDFHQEVNRCMHFGWASSQNISRQWMLSEALVHTAHGGSHLLGAKLLLGTA